MNQVTKIVITGSPCDEKTAALYHIQKTFSEKGYTVFLISEITAEFIRSEIASDNREKHFEILRDLIKIQLEREQIYIKAAKNTNNKKILLIFDGGIMDNRAYMGDEEFEHILSDLNENEVRIRDNYDAVFHWTAASDSHSSETDKKIISVWVGHPHLRIIGNAGDPEIKIQQLTDEITAFIGDPEPIEIERKYLIEYPDITALERSPFCRRIEISQTYLSYPDGKYFRIRKRGCRGNNIYIKTFKQKISELQRIEYEEIISQDEYDQYINDPAAEKYTVEKFRYCLVYNSRYFELDVFPFWKDKALLEIELTNENEHYELPPYLHIIREVTFEDEYKNYSIAKKISESPAAE